MSGARKRIRTPYQKQNPDRSSGLGLHILRGGSFRYSIFTSGANNGTSLTRLFLKKSRSSLLPRVDLK
jgi:hypothetical protein